MSNISVHNDHTPIAISNEKLQQADKLIDQIMQNMQVFQQQLHNDPRVHNVHTHMSLFESYFSELSPLVSYDSILTQEREDRLKIIKQQNEKIQELETTLASTITSDGVKAKLDYYDNVIRAWYGSLGFTYACLEKYTCNAILYRFTEELQYEPSRNHSNEYELYKQLCEKMTILANNPDFDVYHDQYHGELLDTDKNKKAIKNLFATTFPESTIVEYHARKNDYGSYSIRFSVYISFHDIENFVSSIQPTETNK